MERPKSIEQAVGLDAMGQGHGPGYSDNEERQEGVKGTERGKATCLKVP